MTTDTTALQERIRAAMHEADPDILPCEQSRAAAVLPIIAAEVQAAAEHRATRAEAQSAIRGRAVVMYRERAREAEAQIKAVRELHCSDGHDGTCGGSDCFESCVGCLEDYPCSTIRALDN